MKPRKIYVSFAVVLVVFAFLFFQATTNESKKNLDMNVVDKEFSVRIAPVIQHEFSDEISAIGTLNAKETSMLSSKVAGMVNHVFVDIGNRIVAGEVVISLDKTNYDLQVRQTQAALVATEAVITQAESQFKQAGIEYRRASELIEEKVIPQSRFDASEAGFKTAREAVFLAGAQRDQARVVLEMANEQLRNTEIRSPLSGTVVERNVEIGQVVAPGVQLLRILDQTSLYLDVDLPEADISRLSVGTTAVITVDAFPGQEFFGKVAVTNPMVDRKTRTFRMRIEIQNLSGKLVDGMFARLKLNVGKRLVPAIPRKALHRLSGSGTYYVFVVKDEKAYKQTVKIGTMNDRYVELIDGLQEKDIVIISGVGRLRSGAEVKVQMSENKTDKSDGTPSMDNRW
ncbi:efflux RND transporter periplasmic adaptor subunit [bacterium]|nr:efflux RND transporter periplasmic adaptor subunit [bacterium]